MNSDSSKEEAKKQKEPGEMPSEKRKMKLRVYNSFEEAAIAEARAAAKQPPLERIKETVELILRVYGVTQEQLNNRKKSNRINIIQYK